MIKSKKSVRTLYRVPDVARPAQLPDRSRNTSRGLCWPRRPRSSSEHRRTARRSCPWDRRSGHYGPRDTEWRAAVFPCAFQPCSRVSSRFEKRRQLAPSRHGQEDALLSLEQRFQDPVYGDFLIVTLALADDCVGRREQFIRGFFIGEALGASIPVP